MLYLRILLIVAACSLHISAQTTLKGCLTGDSQHFYFVSVNEHQVYAITGNTKGLDINVNHEIEVRGEPDFSANPWPTFEVDKLLNIFKTPRPSLNPAFTDKATWHAETDQAHRIKFAYPTLMATLADDANGMLPSNFPADKPVAPIARFELPSQLYPNSNLNGGEFAILVDPLITTAKGCSAFKDDDPKFHSSSTIAGVHYASTLTGDPAGGTFYRREYLHTFQNRRCYEFGFLFPESNTGNYDLGCLIPSLRREDELNIIQPLMNAVSYLAP